MRNLENLKLVYEAIKSVKREAQVAMSNGDFIVYSQKMYDLMALENCLLTEVEKTINSENESKSA